MPAGRLSAGLLLSCQQERSAEGKLQPVNLAISVGASQATKVDVSTFTEVNPVSPSFRGLESLVLVPFDQEELIEGSFQANAHPISIPGFYSFTSDTPHAYFFSSGVEAWIPTGTASFLLYGRAPGVGTDSDSKHRYGSLVEGGFTGSAKTPLASSLTFSPETMFKGGKGGETPEAAKKIAVVLNAIMLGNADPIDVYYGDNEHKGISLNWNENTEDSNLREAFKQITNEGAFIPGSGPLVEALLSGLYGMLKNYSSHNSNVYEVVVDGVPYEARKKDGTPLLYADLYNSLRDHVLQRFQLTDVRENASVDENALTIRFKDESLQNYPENLGLPSGCAILRWTPSGFVVPQVNGVEGIAPMNRYCFPPALYYYCNTTIRTSMDENIAKSYTDKGYTTWSQILADYTLGNSITSHTQSIALVEPAHFAVAMLDATIQANQYWLQDNDGLPETTVNALGENLPLTGIILSGQYKQNFDFTPPTEPDPEEEYYIYDNQVPGVFLTEKVSAPIRTLSLQTPAGQDVYFTLEFLNNSGKTFYGADGRILPGRKFYMVGKLKLPANPAFKSVFMKDRVTKVTCKINSLDGAYNAIPDLGVPQLVVGVQTQVNWILSSPVTMMLE